ncbi:MAG: TonB-dependent receptor [Deltaproteobacteria bacterium]|nr:TonB-dependent receptor [Deltaproteobacteria bacterium]
MRQSLFLASFFLLMFSLKAWPENTASQPEAHQLEEIVVTATRSETSREQVAANITVITRDDMEKMPASNAAEVLQYIPGVYVGFMGGLGSEATAQILGSEVRHVAVYQDGVPLNQLLEPKTDLSYLPIDAIERIEVYKGAASSAWGSSLGGVINIITKEPDPQKPFAADVRTSYGEFKTSKSRGTVSGTVARFGYLLSLTHDESDGFVEHTEYEQDAVYGKLNYELGETSRLNFAYSYEKGENQDPVLNLSFLWDDVYRRRTYQRLLFETSPVQNLNLTIEGRHHRFYNRADDVYPAFDDFRMIYNDYLDEIWGVSARVRYDVTEANTLNLGFDEDWGEFDWVSEVWNRDMEGETRNWATYANDTFTVGDFSFNAGLRYDDNRDFGGEFSPSGGAVYRIPGVDALIRAQIAKGFSVPDVLWVHHPKYGNPDLDPETAINYQLGGEVQPFQFLRFELNLFRADIKDLVVKNEDTERYENIEEVTRQGIEGNITASFGFGLTLSFGGSYVDVRNEKTDEVIENIPRKQFKVSACYANEWMKHSIVGRYIDHNSTYPETDDKVFIFDYLLKLTPPFLEPYGKPSLFAAVYNLTNDNYLYRGDWPQPDRWVEGGVSFNF